jgi:hypothetical protein
MPVDLTLTYADGASETVRLPVEIWFLGNHYVDVRAIPRDLAKVEIDARHGFPDVRRGNDVWVKP